MSDTRIPLYYTFGNHMHWVDMEWLWGYHVLPGSVRDMLFFCNQTGAKGNINFEGAGYEKMAAEAPEALADLRAAIARGQIEVVGSSYGQPYGLFHGGESNVRQRVYGARAALRLLGVRPRTFWEEEFDFFPQLPQILAKTGFRYASLYFQWTWHTPEVPWESIPAIWWEGMDGTRLLTASRNKLNLHQWPEDFAALLASSTLREMPVPGIVQWLELMPSPDWMCRAEVMLPQLHKLMDNPDFDVRFVTLSEYLEAARDIAEPRRYTLDDVFHGMSIGKNGDLFRRLSRTSEQSALTAESLAALLGFFRRPYAQWDVYPTWELEEAWRELLAAQHHDNDECEGLCGHIGLRSYERSLAITDHIKTRSLRLLARRTAGPAGRVVVYNPLGWRRTDVATDPATGVVRIVEDVPAMGYVVLEHFEDAVPIPLVVVEEIDHVITMRRGSLCVTADRTSGLLTQITSKEFPDGLLRADCPLALLEMTCHDVVETFALATVEVTEDPATRQPTITIRRVTQEGATLTILVRLAPHLDAVDVSYRATDLPRTDSRMHSALHTTLGVALPSFQLIHDHPFGVSPIRAEGEYWRKYPTGDWMTSPQVYEKVHNPFTAQQLLDFDDGERGVLFLHDGSQGMWRDEDRVQHILTMYDAWDEDYFVGSLDVNVRIVPHGPLAHADRWKMAQAFVRPLATAASDQLGGDLPLAFAGLWCDAENVAVVAYYRETEDSGVHLEEYAGRGVDYAYVVRLVEWNGQPVHARLAFPGNIAAAYRTNLMGERDVTLQVDAVESPVSGLLAWHAVTVELRPYEIATLYLDLVQGRKVTRDLDSHRSVWATSHWITKES